MSDLSGPVLLDATDRAILRATQSGLPLVPRPYAAVGATLGLSGAEVMTRMRRMQDLGVIRRIAAVPNHYALGYVANGMSVWDVADEQVDALGARVGGLACVSHCYRRPRHLPQWPYNLFAMVHGRSRSDVESRCAIIRELLGTACRAGDVLYSTRILKKTGLRIQD
jgi:DNA-binding Lrp family transcriptional regulator